MHARLPRPRLVADAPHVTVLVDGVPEHGGLLEQLVVGHDTEGTQVSRPSESELIFAGDQLGAQLRERCMAAGVDVDAVVWAAREQMRLVVSMYDDVDPDDELLNGACGMAAWWAFVVGTGLGALDLVADARRWWGA